jgi:hypothetical protein
MKIHAVHRHYQVSKYMREKKKKKKQRELCDVNWDTDEDHTHNEFYPGRHLESQQAA